MKTFEEKLQAYAELAVRVGGNVQPGQVVYVKGDVETAQLLRMIVKESYKAGASNVVWDYLDDVNIRTKYELAPEETFRTYYKWDSDKLGGLCDQGAVFISIVSQNPDNLKGIDPKLISTFQKTVEENVTHWRNCLNTDKNSWSIVAAPSKPWADKVFPNDKESVAKLWEAIFAATRINEENPVEAWTLHNERLHEKVHYLNNRKYRKLHYKSAVTDLTVGLHPTHIWCGAGSTNQYGLPFMANLPTEEVFTCPARNEVDGVVCSTKPLVYLGNVIENFKLTYKNGRCIEVQAEKGEDVLRNLIESDEGAHYLGEAALVPFDSPISNTNVLFYLTLFDENASNHFAIGRGYAFTVEGGKEMSKEELEAVQVNQSLSHVDFMIGSSDMDIDGIKEDGTVEPIFRAGNWAF